MASVPGFRFDITGASGSQGFLGPKSSWRAYVLPRGGYASQDSTGTLITFDSASVASRFATNNWIQSGLSTANIRQVSAVGGNSLSIGGAALTVTENDRIYLIGNTQPTVSGGSATYTVPATLIYQRDDDTGDLYTNSMITSNADGLVQGFASPNFYDVIIQNGDRSNQGSLIDLAVGAVDGASFGGNVVIGGSLTVNGAIGVTGWATFGSTVTVNAAIGVTGTAVFGATVTMNAAFGVTGVATLSGRVAMGHSLSIDGALGVTGIATFSNLITGSSGLTISAGAVSLPANAIGTTEIEANTIIPTTSLILGSTATVGVSTGALNSSGVTGSYTGSSGNVGALILGSVTYVVTAGASGDAGTGTLEVRLMVGGSTRTIQRRDYVNLPASGSLEQVHTVSLTWFEPAIPTTATNYAINDILTVTNTPFGVSYRGDLQTGWLRIVEFKR